jgi:hypothetical protein
MTISSDDHSSGDASLWSTDEINHGDWLFFYVDSVTDITKITIVLELA